MEEAFEKKINKKESEQIGLEKRLATLIGKKVTSFSVSLSAMIELKFEDGTTLEFISWNAYDDKPDFNGVEVKSNQ